ncbi:MAG: hydrogenase maturation peptidase HycI [Methanolinea sp.]|jgi:hydrogenase 3 maturation protease|nr:hydrogenase maturation peptidase HycI [Methanolinea sp.]
MTNLLLGIGNSLRRDDGAGNYVVSRFRVSGWRVVDCGTAPENFSGLVREEHPDILIMVDAADMGMAPGEFSLIPKEKIRDAGLGTHQLPLDIFIDFLADAAGEILLIGIQPEVVEMGEGLSPAVREGADRLVALLEKGEVQRIPEMGGE